MLLVPFLLLIAVSGWAQMPSKPGAEVKKIEYFLGTWTTEGMIAPGPWGAGGKFSSTDTTEWMPGGFFLVGHNNFKMPVEIGGEGTATSFMGYDAEANQYTFDEFNSQGRRETSKGTLSGDTWTWTSSQVYAGQDIKQKLTIKTLTPASYNMKFEISMDGTTWTTFMDGKSTKK
jgi:hypothetical protein